jgi:hypothetical protein
VKRSLTRARRIAQGQRQQKKPMVGGDDDGAAHVGHQPAQGDDLGPREQKPSMKTIR